MPPPDLSHPDRAATTLANVDAEAARRGPGPFAAPGPGAADCRIGQKLLQWRALAAVQQAPAAAARLAPFARDTHPDLWAGTVRDGTSRGFQAALEEAVALAPNAPQAPPADRARTFVVGKDLRKRRELLVEHQGVAARFSRRDGLAVQLPGLEPSPNCLRFEARRDLGTLDGFVADPAERPRLFSAQFLQPVEYSTGPGGAELLLRGRLGRGPIGWPCELRLRAAPGGVSLALRLEHRVPGYRLRARFLGLPAAAIVHHCTDVCEVVRNDAGGFVAFTLVRANGTLLVDGAEVAVPGALDFGTLEHTFVLGPTG